MPPGGGRSVAESRCRAALFGLKEAPAATEKTLERKYTPRGFVSLKTHGETVVRTIAVDDAALQREHPEGEAPRPVPFRPDALQALIRMGMGHAADALSDLAACPVALGVPAVAVGGSGPELLMRLGGQEDVAVVSQGFAGRLNGTAMLVMPCTGAARLVALLLHEEADGLDTETRTVLTEVGNIVLNGLLGVMINPRSHHTAIHLPAYHEGSVRALANGLPTDHRAGIGVPLDVTVGAEAIAGQLVMVTTPDSLAAILADADVEA